MACSKRKILMLSIFVFLFIILFSIDNISFGASFDYTDVNGTITTINIPSWVTDNNYNFYLMVAKIDTVYKACFVVSQGNIKFKPDSVVQFYSDDGLMGYGGYQMDRLSDIKSRIENAKPQSSWSTSAFTPYIFLDVFRSNTYQYLSNTDILNYNNGQIYYPSNSIKLPEITNTISELETLDFSFISVNANNWSNKDLTILFYDLSLVDSENVESLYPKNEILLTPQSPYYNNDGSTSDNAIYNIPNDATGLIFNVGGSYQIRLAERIPFENEQFPDVNYTYSYLGNYIDFTISSNVSQDKLDQLNEQTKALLEQQRHDETINKMDDINNSLTNTTPSDSISSDIDSSLEFDNQNEALNNLNGGFFTRLTTMLSNLLGYNLSDDTSVSIPLPNTNKSIVLHSKIIYDNVTGTLRLIINAFWVYIFSFYLWKFINKIYIAISTGNILDTFSSSGEAITNDML